MNIYLTYTTSTTNNDSNATIISPDFSYVFNSGCSMCGADISLGQPCQCAICKTCGSEFVMHYRKSRNSCNVELPPLIMRRCLECLAFDSWEGEA